MLQGGAGFLVKRLSNREAVGEDFYVKTAEDRTDFTMGRDTCFGEELEALKKYNECSSVSEYFPDPLEAYRNGGDLVAYRMSCVDTDTRIEYALDDGY